MALKRLISINVSTFNQLISNSAILSSLNLAYNGQNFHMGLVPKNPNERIRYLMRPHPFNPIWKDVRIHCNNDAINIINHNGCFFLSLEIESMLFMRKSLQQLSST